MEESYEKKIDAIEKNKALELVKMPNDKETIGVKWLYKGEAQSKRFGPKKQSQTSGERFCYNLVLTIMRFLF